MLDKLTVDDFSPRVGHSFRLTLADGGELSLELTEATAVGGTPAAREQFSVVFRGPAEPMLPQAIYHLHDDELGELDLFLVPMTEGTEGVEYEAVFT